MSGAVVASTKGIAIGTEVTGGRVELDFSLDAPSALVPLLVGTGVADELKEGIGVGNEGIGVATDEMGDTDVLFTPGINGTGDVVKVLDRLLLGEVVEVFDTLPGDVDGIDVDAARLLLLPGEVVPAIGDVDGPDVDAARLLLLPGDVVLVIGDVDGPDVDAARLLLLTGDVVLAIGDVDGPDVDAERLLGDVVGDDVICVAPND